MDERTDGPAGPSTETPVTKPRTGRRILLVIGGSALVTVLITLATIPFVDVVGDTLALVLYVLVPIAVSFVLGRGLSVPVRIATAIGSLLVVWIILMVVFMIALSSMEFAAVG